MKVINMLKPLKWLIIIVVLMISLATISCSEMNETDMANDEKYTLVLESDEKTWWFEPDSIKTANLPDDEKILEVRVKIDHKDHEIIEMVKWYISAEAERYKSTTVTIYNYENRVVEQ